MAKKPRYGIIMKNDMNGVPSIPVTPIIGKPLEISPQAAKEVMVSDRATFKWKNELVEGRFKLSRLEFHLLAALTAHIDRNADEFELLCVSANDLGALLGLSLNNRFDDLEKVVEGLNGKKLKFDTVEKIAAGTPKARMTTSWFVSIFYNYEQRTITFKFSPELKPLLLKVSKAYVEMPVKKLLPLKRVHSNNLYLKLESWKHKNYDYRKQIEDNEKWEKAIDIIVLTDDFKEMLGLGNSYSKYKELKKYVLDPTLEEINNYDSSMIVTCEPIREGRKNTKIKFTLTPVIDVENENAENTNTEVEPPVESPQKVTEPKKPAKRGRPKKETLQLNEEQKSVFDEMLLLGLRRKEAEEFIKERPVEEIKISIDGFKKEVEKGTVRSPGGLLRTAIAERYWVAEARAKAQEAAAKEAQDKDKFDNMTPEQKAAYLSYQDMLKQAAELASQKSEGAEKEETDWERTQKAAKEMIEKLKKLETKK